VGEFRARLRIPQTILWLGCVVVETQYGVTKNRRLGYQKLKFDRPRVWAIYNAYQHHMRLYRRPDTRPYRVGDRVNLLVGPEILPFAIGGSFLSMRARIIFED